MFNKAPKNTVASATVLMNKLPCVRNNISQSYLVIVQNVHEKADLQKTKVNAMKITKVRADGNKLRTGKEWRP